MNIGGGCQKREKSAGTKGLIFAERTFKRGKRRKISSLKDEYWRGHKGEWCQGGTAPGQKRWTRDRKTKQSVIKRCLRKDKDPRERVESMMLADERMQGVKGSARRVLLLGKKGLEKDGSLKPDLTVRKLAEKKLVNGRTKKGNEGINPNGGGASCKKKGKGGGHSSRNREGVKAIQWRGTTMNFTSQGIKIKGKGKGGANGWDQRGGTIRE